MPQIATIAAPQAPGDAAALGDSLARDVLFTDTDLTRVARLVHRWAGIVLNEQKHGMVYGRLARQVREAGYTRFSDYLDRLEQSADPVDRESFVNALTTNLTAFFREPHHFVHLSRHLEGRTGPVRIWCAAASTGEEAYSIAITAREVLGESADVKVVATDIDTAALAHARRGVYLLEEVRKLEARQATKYFLRGQGRYARYARVRPQVAAMVEFAALNLASPHWPELGGPFDAIFCRNVMIYFDRATQSRILSKFRPLLKPDGLLFIGHSENISYVSDQYRLRGQTVYTLAR